jgi:hypothetical protein
MTLPDIFSSFCVGGGGFLMYVYTRECMISLFNSYHNGTALSRREIWKNATGTCYSFTYGPRWVYAIMIVSTLITHTVIGRFFFDKPVGRK